MLKFYHNNVGHTDTLFSVRRRRETATFRGVRWSIATNELERGGPTRPTALQDCSVGSLLKGSLSRESVSPPRLVC